MRFSCLVVVNDTFELPMKKSLGRNKVDFKALKSKLLDHLKKFNVKNESLYEKKILIPIEKVKQDQLDLIERVKQGKYLDKIGLCDMNLKDFAINHYKYVTEDEIDGEGNVFCMENPHGHYYSLEIGLYSDKAILTSATGKSNDVMSASEFDYDQTLSVFQEVFPNEQLQHFFTVAVIDKNLNYFEMKDDNDQEWQQTFKEKFLDTLQPSDTIILLDMHL